MVAEPADRIIAMENITDLLLLPENERLLRAHIRTLVRLSTESPYEDVMDGCQKILVRVSRVYTQFYFYIHLFIHYFIY